MEIALAMEAAFKDSRNLFHKKNEFETVNKVKPRNSKFSNSETNDRFRKKNICIRCNSEKHKQENCSFIKVKSHYCNKIGHLRKCCLLEKKLQFEEDKNKRMKQKKVNCIDEEVENFEENKNKGMKWEKVNSVEEEEETFEIFNIVNISKPPKPWKS